MKKPLYRGKRLDNGEWIEGYAYCNDNISRIIYAIAFESENDNESYYCEGYDIDRNTLGEYVGLTDKNGKNIFEGDIILTANKKLCIVMLKDFEYIITNIYGEYIHRLENEDNGKYEVFGNIYDNKELLAERK